MCRDGPAFRVKVHPSPDPILAHEYPHRTHIVPGKAAVVIEAESCLQGV